MLEDLAILTGVKAITEDRGIKLENVKLQGLGRAKKVTIEGRHDDEGGKRFTVITYSLPRNPFLENAKKSARFYKRMRRLRAKTLLVPLPHDFAVIRFLLLTVDRLLGGFLQVHFHCLRKRSVRFGIDSFGVND